MTELIAFLSSGKGTWGHVSRLMDGMNNQQWEQIYLLTNQFGKEKFTPEKKNVELIALSEDIGLRELRDEILDCITKKVKGNEVAVNFISGTGKEHMALLSALIKSGKGFRMIALTKDGIEEV